jgi:hypothetical protein
MDVDLTKPKIVQADRSHSLSGYHMAIVRRRGLDSEHIICQMDFFRSGPAATRPFESLITDHTCRSHDLFLGQHGFVSPVLLAGT